MDIRDIRIEQLRRFFSPPRSIPEKEKSYFSQLFAKKAPFGERAARRLEKTYGMGEKYLDSTSAEGGSPAAPMTATDDGLEQGVRLLSLFQRADQRGRAEILRNAERFAESARLDDAARNDG